jgi:hypothetical protein
VPAEPRLTVVLRSIDAVRAEKKVYAVYFCGGESQVEALRRLITLHTLGIINIAKLTPQDVKDREMSSFNEAEDQSIIVYGADGKEIVRFSQQSSEEEFMKLKMTLSHKLAVGK